MPRTIHGLPGIYNATPLTLTDGEGAALALNSRGEAIVEVGGLAAGEDVTNDVQKVEHRYSTTYISTATTTLIKTGAGLLHAITLGETAAGAITIYDNTSAAGTIIDVLKASIAEQTFLFDAEFAVGLTIITAGASKLSVSFR